MGVTQPSEVELAPYIERLRELPFVRDVQVLARGGRGDGMLRLKTPAGRVDLRITLLRSHLAAGAGDHLKPSADDLLLAPHIGAPIGAELEARGTQFLDRAGNCFLQLPIGYVARVQGRTAAKPGREKAQRAPAYQVLFALLAEPTLLGESLRAIARAAGTSRQAVVDAIDRLASEGYLISGGRERRWTEQDRTPLLDRWVEGYQQAVRPRLLVGRFRLREKGPPAVERQLTEQLGETVRFGGTAGAYRLVGHYRGPLTTIHHPSTDATRRRLRALRADDGELVWLAPLGEIGDQSSDPTTVNPLLIYAELCHDPDPRARELAGLLRSEHMSWAR